jgi:GxxExxY protein
MDAIQMFAREIYATLGPGYSERVYHNAFEVILRQNGVPYETERIIPIEFRGIAIGNVRADLIVDKKWVVELKAVKTITEAYRNQAKKYRELLRLEGALLVNFGDEINICEC